MPSLESSEQTPLLHSSSRDGLDDSRPPPHPDAESPSLSSCPSRRAPSKVALVALCASIISVLAVGFFAPAVAEQYARQAVVLNVSSLSVESFTPQGVNARVQATVSMDAGRVQSGLVRCLGRLGTFVARKITTAESKVQVLLPDYDRAILGTATVPDIVIDVRNGRSTAVDFVAEVQPGSVDAVRRLAKDYLDGDLKLLRILGQTELSWKSGLIHFGAQEISKEMLFKELPALPNFDISRLNFAEIALPNKQTAIEVNASATIENPYPLDFEVPSLGFSVLLPGCKTHNMVNIATAVTSKLAIKPNTEINADVSAIIRNLPDALTDACPQSHDSPMDKFLDGYIHGLDSTIFVTGSDSQDPNAPAWISEFLKSVTLPVVIPLLGNKFGNLVESFGLSNVNFQLPAPEAKPGSPEALPHLSATVNAVVKLPNDMKFSLDVKRMRAEADVSYKGQKFGTLDMKKWMPAKSVLAEDGKHLNIMADVRNAPLDVTDYDVFERVIGKLIFDDGTGVRLGIDGNTDIDVKTTLGEFVVKQIPASGNITIKGFEGFGSLPLPTANEVTIEDTTPESITLIINVTVDNPTPWEADIPYVNIHVTHEGFVLGNASVSNMHLATGKNTFDVRAIWDPRTNGGYEAQKLGERLVSEYISGKNTTLTLKPHAKSLPSLPLLSGALQDFEITIPTPHISNHDGGDTPAHILESATIHILTSTATFLINSPLQHTQITITKVNGTAEYKGSELGTIFYDRSFLIKPGDEGTTLTPKLPVKWRLGNVGHEAVKRALGGTLRVHAEAECEVMVGELVMQLFYNSSRGLGAHVRP